MKGVKISDYQQSMSLRPLREAILISPALLVVADLVLGFINTVMYFDLF